MIKKIPFLVLFGKQCTNKSKKTVNQQQKIDFFFHGQSHVSRKTCLLLHWETEAWGKVPGMQCLRQNPKSHPSGSHGHTTRHRTQHQGIYYLCSSPHCTPNPSCPWFPKGKPPGYFLLFPPQKIHQVWFQGFFFDFFFFCNKRNYLFGICITSTNQETVKPTPC